jgi:hypothetical protein
VNTISQEYLEYLKKKCIPVDVDLYCGTQLLPTSISPAETICPVCPGNRKLSLPILKTRKARIYDIDGITQGIAYHINFSNKRLW